MCFLNPIWCEHSAADRKKHQSQIRRWVFYRNVDEAAANANRVSEHVLPSAAAGLEDFISFLIIITTMEFRELQWLVQFLCPY